MTARTLGHSIEGLALNRSTIRRQRRRHREAKSSAIMDDFKLMRPLIVHWDGKIMEDLKVKERGDRLPVLGSSMGTSKLLGHRRSVWGRDRPRHRLWYHC